MLQQCRRIQPDKRFSQAIRSPADGRYLIQKKRCHPKIEGQRYTYRHRVPEQIVGSPNSNRNMKRNQGLL